MYNSEKGGFNIMSVEFNTKSRHRITEANINYYAFPFVHPKRKMKEHDFIYVLDGEWKLGQEEKEFSLQKNSLLILEGGKTHYGISPCAPGTKTMYFHAGLPEDSASRASAEDAENIRQLTDASSNPNIKKLFYEIVTAKMSGDGRRASAYFDLLIYELSAFGSDEEGDTGERIKAIIHKNPEKFYTNAELGKKLGISDKSAETKFKRRYGITIHKYTLDFKMEQAISYFKVFPEMSIKEIAFNLGFYDEYHFSRQFKKIKGIPPSLYKKELSERRG